MNRRRGFVLITVLWVTAALTGIIAALLADARTTGHASRNRILLTRASWAAEACLAILQADTAFTEGRLAAVDLGNGTWCAVDVVDPERRLNLNLASRDQLLTLVRNDSLVDAILDWRDADTIPRPHGAEARRYLAEGSRVPRDSSFASLDELRYVRGWATADTTFLKAALTTDGTGRINPNVAPPTVLATLPGLDAAGVDAIRRARERGPFRSYDGLIGVLPPLARAHMLSEYRSFLASSNLEGTAFTATASGWVSGAELRATKVATIVSITGRPTILRTITP